jgi:hypothetical protein
MYVKPTAHFKESGRENYLLLSRRHFAGPGPSLALQIPGNGPRFPFFFFSAGNKSTSEVDDIFVCPVDGGFGPDDVSFLGVKQRFRGGFRI